jgi:Calcium-binding EGF domain/EGF domain
MKSFLRWSFLFILFISFGCDDNTSPNGNNTNNINNTNNTNNINNTNNVNNTNNTTVCQPGCDENAICEPSQDGAYCVCNDGYSGDGVTCTDINECSDGTNNCDENATCENGDGGFVCTCNPPLVGDGTECLEPTDCSNDSSICGTNATCTDQGGDQVCLCDTGFTGDGLTCSDIDECSNGTDNCDSNATCGNIDGNFTCICNSGYNGDGEACADDNECDLGTDNCHDNASCTNIDGGFTCECNSAYNGDGETCSDNDECTLGTDNCAIGATCTNIDGGFSCACDSGFTGDGTSCIDNNECALLTHNCDENATCQNTWGAFDCNCNIGYSGIGTTCTDDDECILDTDNCDVNATCSNTIGSFTCECPSKYTDVNGDGTLCDPSSCQAIVDIEGAGLTDGEYSIDRGMGLISVYCDMTTHVGAGYTMYRTDDATNLVGSQTDYFNACANIGMEVIVPRNRAHAESIRTWNGETPNIVNVFPKYNGASGLANWTGTCDGSPCDFYLSNSNTSNCSGFEPNGDNNVNNALYNSDSSACDYGRWNDANNGMAIIGWVICSTNDAVIPLSTSCAEGIELDNVYNVGTNGISGVYTIDTDGSGSATPFGVYCDQLTDGGGWTAIAKVGAGNYTALTDQEYIDLVMNPLSNINEDLLLTNNYPTNTEMAFLSKELTNALWSVSTTNTVRVQMSNNTLTPAANGNYYQQAVTALSDWDLWSALRDSRYWGDGTTPVDSYVPGEGTAYILNGPGTYDAVNNTFVHGGDGSFGWWSLAIHNLNDGTTLEVSRHGGLLCDGFNNYGYLWLLTLDNADPRWKNDDHFARSIVWLK